MPKKVIFSWMRSSRLYIKLTKQKKVHTKTFQKAANWFEISIEIAQLTSRPHKNPSIEIQLKSSSNEGQRHIGAGRREPVEAALQIKTFSERNRKMGEKKRKEISQPLKRKGSMSTENCEEDGQRELNTCY